MKGPMRVVLIVVLLAIIAGGVGLLIKRARRGSPKPPQWVTGKQIELIDSESLDVMTKPLGEWLDLGLQDGKVKNPKTGKFTMTTPGICPSCGAKVPTPVGQEEIANYQCPKCGSSAQPQAVPEESGPPAGPPGPAGPAAR